MTIVDDIAGHVEDNRCCGDHPNEWNTQAEPGHGFCHTCLTRLEANPPPTAEHPAPSQPRPHPRS